MSVINYKSDLVTDLISGVAGGVFIGAAVSTIGAIIGGVLGGFITGVAFFKNHKKSLIESNKCELEEGKVTGHASRFTPGTYTVAGRFSIQRRFDDRDWRSTEEEYHEENEKEKLN